MHDVIYALRLAIRRPALPRVLVTLLLALGVAVATGLWAVIDAAFLRPLPYPQADRLVMVLERHPERGLMAVTPANFLDWSERVPEFRDAAAAVTTDASLAAADRPGVVVAAMAVTGRFFSVLGTRPAAGREIGPADVTQHARVAVVSHRVWQSYLNAAPSAVGEVVRLDGEPFEIVGIMPEGFRTFDNADIWTPLRMGADEWRERRFHLLTGVARLRPGSPARAAQHSLDAIYAAADERHPDTNRGWRASVVGLRDTLTEGTLRSLVILEVAVGMVVAIACVNVAGILAVYLPTRRAEFSTRLALGATIARIVRQILVETLLWAAAALPAGLLLAGWLVGLFGRMALPTTWQFDFEPRLDLRVAAIMLLVLTGIVVAITVVPAALTARRAGDLVPKRAGRGPGRVVRGAAIVQVALTVLLLTLTFALLAGYRQLTQVRRTRHGGDTIAVRVTLPELRYADGPAISRLFQQLLDRLNTRPEIALAAAASYVPPETPRGNVRFTIEGRATSSDALTALPSAVTPAAFSLLEVPLVRGRLLDPRDAAASPHVAVISEALARRYWPGEDPVGRRISMVGVEGPYTIVGVVANVRQPLSAEPRAEAVLYLSYLQNPWPYMTIMIVPTGPAAPAAAALREELQALDRSVAAGAVQTLDDVRGDWLSAPRLRTSMVTAFAAATLLLTLVGLYARVAHGVAVRQREFAIRQAIGASPAHLTRGVLLETIAVILAGGAAALVCLPAAQQLLRSAVQGAAPLSEALGFGVAVVLTVLGTSCAYLPARRAGRLALAPLLRE